MEFVCARICVWLFNVKQVIHNFRAQEHEVPETPSGHPLIPVHVVFLVGKLDHTAGDDVLGQVFLKRLAKDRQSLKLVS